MRYGRISLLIAVVSLAAAAPAAAENNRATAVAAVPDNPLPSLSQGFVIHNPSTTAIMEIKTYLKQTGKSALDPVSFSDLEHLSTGAEPQADPVEEEKAAKRAELQRQLAEIDNPPAAPVQPPAGAGPQG